MNGSFAGAPPLQGVGTFLVYFRADHTGEFPSSPFHLVNGIPKTLVIAELGSGSIEELCIIDAITVDYAMGVLFQKIGSGSVWTVHSNSVLGRLVRWHALKTGQQAPAGFRPGAIKDIVEAVNAPAVLTGNWRYSFKTEDYIGLLGLKPDPRFDPETGTLADMIHRYGYN